MILRRLDGALIRNSPRGGDPLPHVPDIVYVFDEATRRELLQDPKCNKEVFEAALEETDDLRDYSQDEKWMISEVKLQEAGLGHWKASSIEL